MSSLGERDGRASPRLASLGQCAEALLGTALTCPPAPGTSNDPLTAAAQPICQAFPSSWALMQSSI